MTERAGAGVQGVFRELGLVLRSEYEELELRVAQLEHRMKLVERDDLVAAAPAHAAQSFAVACKTDAVATQSTQRNLGRLSEIAQVAVRHGFGYFLEKHKLTDLLPWGQRSAAEAIPRAASAVSTSARCSTSSARRS